jgi:hypothetical protein
MRRLSPAPWRSRIAAWLCVIGLIALLPLQLRDPLRHHQAGEFAHALGDGLELCLAQPDEQEPAMAPRPCAFCCVAQAVLVPAPPQPLAVRLAWAERVSFVPARAPPAVLRAELPATGPRAPPLLG